MLIISFKMQILSKYQSAKNVNFPSSLTEESDLAASSKNLASPSWRWQEASRAPPTPTLVSSCSKPAVLPSDAFGRFHRRRILDPAKVDPTDGDLGRTRVGESFGVPDRRTASFLKLLFQPGKTMVVNMTPIK